MTEHAGATFDTDNPLARPERAGDSSTPRASEPTHKLAMMHQSSRLEHMRVTAIQGWEDRAKELATKEQFVQDLKKVITDEKAALVEKAKAEAGTKGSTKGQDNPVHHSNNTLGDLDIGIALNTPKRPVSWVWALVFQLPRECLRSPPRRNARGASQHAHHARSRARHETIARPTD